MKLLLAVLAAWALCAGAPSHRFVCTDYTQGKVFVVAEDGQVEWSYDAPDANDIWLLPNGNLLFNTGHGVKEVTHDKRVVFSYESTSEIYACQRMPKGCDARADCAGVVAGPEAVDRPDPWHY